MRFDWLMAAMLAGAVVTGSVGGARSQTTAPVVAPSVETRVQPAPANTAAPADQVAAPLSASEMGVSPVITEAEKKLEAAEAAFARLTKRVDQTTDNDNALVDLKLEVGALARSMLDIGVSLRPRLTEIKARIDQLGAAPAEGEPAEPDAVAADRARLAEERALINTLTGRAETVSVRASELGDRITEARRALFANTLLKRTEIGPSLLLEAVAAAGNEWSDLKRTYSSWLKFVWTFKRDALLGTAFFAIVAALVFIAGAYRLFGGLFERDPEDEDPPYTSRLSTAFWSIVIPTLAMTALGMTVFGLMQSFSILRTDVTPVVQSVIALLVAIYFISKLARAILAPATPAWRLVNLCNSGAQMLLPLVVALIIVNGLDYVLGVVSQTLGSPVVLTVSKGFFAVVIMALILIVMSRVKPMMSRSGDPADPGEPWPRVISVTLLLAGLGLLATAMLGYVGLARFAATQIIVTGAILTTMYIGYLSSKAISEPGVFAQTAIGRRIEDRFELGHVSLDQSGLGAGLLINLLVLLLGVPLILLQWGFQVQDIQLWFYRLMTEIRIGGITISLVGILFGVVLFLLGLLVTRWFQGWLDGSVMARGRMDTGVRNSIKTGVGYIGVAVAGLIGISAAGIDLSSLALVAGALSLGIGFGLQNIVSNFVSGLILLAERPFKVGDWVVTGSTEGFVKKISVRATEIETFTRQSIIVPNSELINAPVGNWTHRNSLGRIEVAVGVSYEADPRKVIEILSEIVRDHEMVLSFPEPAVHFVGFGDSSLDFEVRAHLADVLSGLSVRTELRLRIFERFKAEGIEIPFPQRDLNIKLGSEEEPLAALREKTVGTKTTLAQASGKDAADQAGTTSSGHAVPSKSAQDSMDEGNGSEGDDR
ncbi:mechanosensitive ion channel family protein [Hoeflea sp. YIM 152468]|uniref:mechanosensitive ion channel family protein n=1 Tax=Hoeflea sp. YIM 152468 TaxID=3031759 RepID=UPI0023DA9EBF|nr:mechanosensitive ion channel family protein [Hoeflea sp. YIM 152468]MDF1607584.1 mechanosensitive ion channel family protein [Hoeflea sp. YIM 152468]